MYEIIHFVGLSGIGGVQRNFSEYIDTISSDDKLFNHKVYTLGSVDDQYNLPFCIHNIAKLKNFIFFIKSIISNNTIVHLYNNLSSLKLALLLLLIPANKLIVHERGTIWNQPTNKYLIPCFIAWKSTLILANSRATKTMLVKKFSIIENKIKVLHNGISLKYKDKYIAHNINTKKRKIFTIGFIGRLDSPKGVHVLIESMRFLNGYDVILKIAGDGVLEENLRQSASSIKSIEFIGRVNNPYSFLDKIDLLVVPSIREPLGNVCLEAGLCKTPVLATNVDGIPEIIEHKISGELIDATDEISIDLPEGAVPLPEFVVNPVNQQLCTPKQINPSLLAKKILELSSKPEKLKYYANELHTKVTNYFNINRYRTELYNIYQDLYHL